MNKQIGFTLIELLIVVAIIAILAAIAIPNFLMAQVRAKVSTSKGNLRSLATAMESYRVDQTSYPPDQDLANFGGNYGGVITLFRLTTPVAYITSIPTDPFNYNIRSYPQQAQYINLFHDYWYFGEYTIDWWYANAPSAIPRFVSNGFMTTSSRWILSGNGPYGFYIGQDEAYDPTNGTVSYGCINRSGP